MQIPNDDVHFSQLLIEQTVHVTDYKGKDSFF